jgi:acetylornithine deacetylase/succinyl-diaminopimelate desuccinylase-like protein
MTEGWDPERLRLIERAWSHIDASALADTLAQVVDIPSPAGEERALAEWLVGRMASSGLEAEYQELSESSGSAIGRIRGTGDGPTLLLFSPIDTAWRGDEADLDILGEAREDLMPSAKRRGDLVLGLSAENPKAYAVACLAAVEAIRRAEIPLAGELVVGLGAGGMPVGPPPGEEGQVGHGLGAARVVEAVRPDHAVVAKPGNAVAYEEVGMVWLRVRVRGTLGYTGVRHLLPYRNPIVDAARLIEALEAWFPEYTKANTSGCVAPQGAVGALRGGWQEAPSFTPAVCEVWVDLRVSPRTPVEGVESQFAEAVERLAGETGADVEWRRELAIPGTSTPPESRIIQSSIRAWELVQGRKHKFRKGTSGGADANVIRAAGVPTARIGQPPVDVPDDLGGFSMGVTSGEAMNVLARTLCAVAVDPHI